MKCRLAFFFALFFLSIHVQAVTEVWETKINPPAKPVSGSNARWLGNATFPLWIILRISKAENGDLNGLVDIRSPDVRCFGEAEIENGNIKNQTVTIKSKPIPVVQCGYFYFKGEVVGNEWVGYIPWNGVRNEAIFRRGDSAPLK